MRFLISVLTLLLLLGSADVAAQQRQRQRQPAGGSKTPADPSQSGPPQRQPGKGKSRIIDDSTKQVYGPNTSRYYYEQDAFYNRPLVYPIDTVIRNFHRFSYVQRNNNLYQDLGTIGTSIRPIYYTAPSTIGVRSGFESYDVYWDSDPIRYFDTKSPYSNINLVLGGRGRSTTKVTYSRNINPRWNFGFNYRGLFIDKQVPLRTGKGDRLVRSNYYDAFMSYATKDSTYRLFTNFRRMFHRAEETGGVRFNTPADSTFENYFDQNARVWLEEAESNDLRSNFHFHHEFRVGNALQVYHQFDRYRQKVRFQDDYSVDEDYFRGNSAYSGDTTWDNSKFKVVRNELGIKGNLLKLFYNGYYAIRHYKMGYNTWLVDDPRVATKGNESYLGGRMELRLDSIGVVGGWAEVNSDGDLRIEGTISSKWFSAGIRQLLYKPGFAEQYYRGRHHQWRNNFEQIEATQLNGALFYRSRVVRISPGFTFTRLGNYVYYDSTISVKDRGVRPVQSNGSQVILSPQVTASLTFFRRFTLANFTVYNSLAKNDGNVIRLPEFQSITQLAYSNIHFNGNFDVQAGVELHWRSAYYAPAYDPAIRQFYNQEFFKVNDYALLDVFVNAKVKRGRVFFKFHNVTQLFTKTGYFATPYYPAQRTVLDFGFDWSFYD